MDEIELLDKIKRLIEVHVLPHAQRSDVDAFRRNMKTEEMSQVLKKHEDNLLATFKKYAQAHLARVTTTFKSKLSLPARPARLVAEYWLHAGFYLSPPPPPAKCDRKGGGRKKKAGKKKK